MPGDLYLIPNTLGDTTLERVLPHAVSAQAASLDYFVAENAKAARAFLKRVNAVVPLARALQDIEIRELNLTTPAERLPELLAPIIAGRDAGLVSDAGCPAIADPGARLVALAHQRGVRVRPLVGPSAVLLALMASGLNGQNFAFQGYLPTDAEERRARIRHLEAHSRQWHQTQIFIETPYRNLALLAALAETLAPRTRLCVACDLSLDGELVETRSAQQWRGAPIDLQRRPTVFLFEATA
jgi:16S rRNA (cytidine1402-2'-O)-methyltransferase